MIPLHESSSDDSLLAINIMLENIDNQIRPTFDQATVSEKQNRRLKASPL